MKTMFFNDMSMLIAAAFLGVCLLEPALTVCAAEQKAHPMQARFKQMDSNGDGKVVLEEFRASFPNMNEKAFVVIDKNNDKGIDRAEWYEFVENHGKGMTPPERGGAPGGNMSGEPMMPPPDSGDLPLVRPPSK